MNDSKSDILNIISILLGFQNLQENREQSEHNDVQVANDKQAKFLLEQINKRFEEQNAMLREQNELLRTIYAWVSDLVIKENEK